MPRWNVKITEKEYWEKEAIKSKIKAKDEHQVIHFLLEAGKKLLGVK